MLFYTKALVFATTCHEGQFRRGPLKLPYIIHPIRVANSVLEFKKDLVSVSQSDLDELMSAALLHDIVEDCLISFKEIKEKFNERIANLVEELTSDQKEIEKMGKTRYLQEKMTKMSLDSLFLKLCDRLDNVSDFQIDQAYFKSTLDILNYVLANRQDLTSLHKKVIEYIFAVIGR